jgi:hypothetical protein
MTVAMDLGAGLASLTAQLAELAEKLVALERENKILREENAILKQGRFGRSSERLDPGQLALFHAEPAEMPAADATVNVPGHERRKRGHGRAPFAEHLPRVTIECDVPQEERSCSTCGKEMHSIGEDVSERGHVVPARIVVNRYVRRKYACSAGHGVVTAAAPPGVIEGAKYDVLCTKTLSGCPCPDSDGIRPLHAGEVPAGERRSPRKAMPRGGLSSPRLGQLKSEAKERRASRPVPHPQRGGAVRSARAFD